MLICGNGMSLQIWVQPPHSSPSPLLPQKMSGNPRWRSDMSEVTEKCMRPRGATYVYCIIDKDRRHWDLLPQESSGLTESIFVCFSLLNPFLCSPVPTCSSSLLSVERTFFFGIWVVLKPSQGFQSTVSFHFSRHERALQSLFPLVEEEKCIPKTVWCQWGKWGKLATYWCVLSLEHLQRHYFWTFLDAKCQLHIMTHNRRMTAWSTKISLTFLSRRTKLCQELFVCLFVCHFTHLP